MADGGIVLRGDDGSAYFIRDEILDACKLEGEYLEAAKPVLDDDAEVEGFALNARATQFKSVGNFSANPGITSIAQAKKPGVDLSKVNVQSTVMCPW